jgi:hypothetical protein
MLKTSAKRIETGEDFGRTPVEQPSNTNPALREQVYDQIHDLEQFTPAAFTVLSRESFSATIAEHQDLNTKAG